MTSERPKVRTLPTLAGVFATALCVRVLHVAALRGSPFFDFMLGDADTYDAWGLNLAAGDWLGQEVFYQAPLYPYFLGVVYATFGHDYMAVRLVQAVLGAGACALLARAGWILFGRSAGIASGLLLAFYAPAIFFDGMVQKSVLDLFFLCLALRLIAGLLARDDFGPARTWFGCGLAMGALILTRENALVLAAILVAWPFFRSASVRSASVRSASVRSRQGRGEPRRTQALCASLALVAGLACALLPVAVRNQIVGGEFHLTTSQLGTNLYIGNNPAANGSYMPLRPGRGSAKYEREDAIALAEQATGRALTPSEVSSYWSGRAIDFATSHPADWLRLMTRKVALLFDAVEAVDSEDQYTVAAWSWPLRATGRFDHFGIIVPLAVLGIFATWGDRRRLAVLYVLMGSYAASVLLFYVFARYRYPLIPFLVLFAGVGLTGALNFMRTATYPVRAACAASVLSIAIFSNTGSPTSVKMMAAVTHYNLGNAYKVHGDPEAAISHYLEALAHNETFPEAHHNLSATYASIGRNDLAEKHYRINLARNPGDALAHNNLANLLAKSERIDAAVRHYRRALALDPRFSEAYYGLGLALANLEEWSDAARHFRRVLALDPDRVGAQRQLGLALRNAGANALAVPHLLEALRTEPHSSDLLRTTAWILATHPDAEIRDGELAIELAQRDVQLSRGQQPRGLDVLAAAYAEAGRFEEAQKTADRAIAVAGQRAGPRARAILARRDAYARGEPHRSSPDRVEGGLEDDRLQPGHD